MRYKGGHFITYGAVFHHSISVNYWSKYLKTSLSNDISALTCLPFGPALLYLFQSGAGSEGLEEICSLCSSEKPVPNPPTGASIFQLKWESDDMSRHVCGWQNPQVTTSTPRWTQWPFLTIRSSQTLVTVLWLIYSVLLLKECLQPVIVVSTVPLTDLDSPDSSEQSPTFKSVCQTLPIVSAGTHNRAWVTAGLDRCRSQN